MNRPIISNETESVIKKFPTNKNPESDGFTGEFYQIFREELTPILLKLFQKTAEEGTTSELILRSQCHPDTKTRQRYYNKKKITYQYH